MRARLPDLEGTVGRDGVNLGFEVHGDGDIAVLLLPTWTIIHSRFWKLQVPYLARHYRVVTYDGPGNGRSDRSADPRRYSAGAYAADALAVLDVCGVDRAVVVGLSLGAQYGVRLASQHPARVSALVLVGPALPLAPPAAERASIAAAFTKPYPANPRGWEKYNLAYWHDHYEDFATFFFRQVFPEPHSTKAIEDAIGWAGETGPHILEAAEAGSDSPFEGSAGSLEAGTAAADLWSGLMRRLTCPVMVVHGTADRIHPHQTGAEAARIASGAFVQFGGSGHMPNVREPVRFNLELRRFIEGLPA